MSATATTIGDLARVFAKLTAQYGHLKEFKFRFTYEDEDGPQTYSRHFAAETLAEAKAIALRWGNDEFGKGKFDFNPYFGS